MDLPALFSQRFSTPPTLLVRAPGAANLMGELVDTRQGPALLVALDPGVQIAAVPVPGDLVNLYSLNLDEDVSFHLEDVETGAGRSGRLLPAWAHGPAGVAWALRRSGYPLAGLQAVISSQVPFPTYLGGSAAIEAGFAVLWQALGGRSGVSRQSLLAGGG